MANICSFIMKVKGEKNNIEAFFAAMEQRETIWMGRGAEASIKYGEDGTIATIDGWCKNSVKSALIDSAVSMRTTPNNWTFGGMNPSELEFITLCEACERYHVEAETYSEESGCCFQEHMHIGNDGEFLDNETVPYFEWMKDCYSSKEEMEKDNGEKFTDEEWNSPSDVITRGGFSTWEFAF